MWSLIAKVGLGLIDFFLKKHEQAVAAREAYLKFVEAMSKDGLISVQLSESYNEQRRKNQEELTGGKPKD